MFSQNWEDIIEITTNGKYKLGFCDIQGVHFMDDVSLKIKIWQKKILSKK